MQIIRSDVVEGQVVRLETRLYIVVQRRMIDIKRMQKIAENLIKRRSGSQYGKIVDNTLVIEGIYNKLLLKYNGGYSRDKQLLSIMVSYLLL